MFGGFCLSKNCSILIYNAFSDQNPSLHEDVSSKSSIFQLIFPSNPIKTLVFSPRFPIFPLMCPILSNRFLSFPNVSQILPNVFPFSPRFPGISHVFPRQLRDTQGSLCGFTWPLKIKPSWKKRSAKSWARFMLPSLA